MASSSNQNSFARKTTETSDVSPPPIAARYFYTSPLAIDDPLAPVPAAATSSNSVYKQPPRPFSAYDNAALEKAWLDVRRRLRKQLAAARQEQLSQRSRAGTAHSTQLTSALRDLHKRSIKDINTKYVSSGGSAANSPRVGPQRIPVTRDSQKKSADGSASSSYRAVTLGEGSLTNIDNSSTTGNPFIRAPTRPDPRAADTLGTSAKSRSASVRPTARPTVLPVDSYNWGEDTFGAEQPKSRNQSKVREPLTPKARDDQIREQVPVGVSRLHSVSLPNLQMEPIYWMPVKDTAPVQRATWFYAENMLPVETDVANLLELGYVEMHVWSKTWKDELDSAVEVGAAGEMKILHRLWPAKEKVKAPSKSGASIDVDLSAVVPESPLDDTNDKELRDTLSAASNTIDNSNGADGTDNKAAGISPWGRDGSLRHYKSAGVIYANDKDAYILRPNLQPSDYYGRRPLAHAIRKNKAIGVQVVRGFDEAKWDRLYNKSKASRAQKLDRTLSSTSTELPTHTQQQIPDPAAVKRPEVTDLVLVIHGIGQKLSERMESYHFTHSINSFRREVNVELGDAKVKPNLRSDCGNIMVLPVNWRLTLSFEDGGYKEDDFASPAIADYSLKDITPSTLPSVRGIVSDVMLDIPYYLTPGYHDKMVAAVVKEANRIYHLWCQNNPQFVKEGRVHIIAHSLGSVMAVDILSIQPTHIQFDKPVAKLSVDELPKTHFAFDVHNLFLAGSPAGFFLLLKRTGLLPRRGRLRADPNDTDTEDDTYGVTGNQGTYGCLAVTNIYNIVNGYDPVAYCLNATIDADYAAALKPAQVPSSSTSWFSSPFRSSSSAASLNHKAAIAGLSNSSSSSAQNTPSKPSLTTRLPSTVELEIHDFTREEIAERKAYLLNDNGQIDYFLKYGGGPLEIQYLTMLGAHSSYWLSKDFVRMVVLEIGRPHGRRGTLVGMRAVKRKMLVNGGRGS